MLISNPNTNFWAEIDNEESYTDLVMAIEFSDRDRVSLFIAVCDVDLIQAQIISRYTEKLVGFHAYQVAVNSHHLSVNRSIAELVEREPYFQTGERVVVSVVGATALASVKLDPEATKSDRDTFFGYLQWTRESFRDFHFPIVLWVSKNIYDLMLSETPDFWSWRTGVFFFKADPVTATGETADLRQLTAADRELVRSSTTSLSLEDLEQLIVRISHRNPEDRLLPNLYNSLGMLHYHRLQTGEYEDYLNEQNLAIECFQQAINIIRKFSDYDRNSLATSLNNLAGLYRSQGKWAEAEPLYDEALAIRRTLFGDRPNNDLAASLNNLAGLYRSQGKWAEAEPLYDEALAICRTLFGERPNNNLATSLNNLAYLYRSQGKWAEAEPLYDEALAICRTLFGDRPNNDLAASLNNLAGLYRSQGKWAEAEPLYVKALAIVEQILGTNHPNTKTIRNNLQTLRQQLELPSING
jgi:tetratricopeptide (TPR) repeat protein